MMWIDKVPNNKSFLRLLYMVKEDLEARTSLLHILEMEPKKRIPVLQKLARHMKKQGESQDIIQALLCLRYDSAAEKFRQMLEK